MDAAQRQAARGLLDMAAQRYIPPELRGLLGLAAEANPVVSMERAGTAAQGLLGRQATPMQRVGYAGDMLSNMAGVVAPAMVASRAGLPAAQALQESVMGFSQAAGIPEFIADESGALRLYHGSPHDFDRFSMDKIGTGTGEQAFGRGLYFSESERVAKEYRDSLATRVDVDGSPIIDGNRRTGSTGNQDIDDMLISFNGDLAAAIADQQAYVKKLGKSPSAQAEKAILQNLKALKGRVSAQNSGRMYEVNVEADRSDFFDYDAFGENQSPAGRAFIQQQIGSVPDNSGGTLLAHLASKAQDAGKGMGPTSGVHPATIEDMKAAGIPGITFRRDGSRNYVVFDENLISIVRKYGIAGAAALYGVSQADIAQAMNPTTDRQTGLLMAQTPPRAD